MVSPTHVTILQALFGRLIGSGSGRVLLWGALIVPAALASLLGPPLPGSSQPIAETRSGSLSDTGLSLRGAAGFQAIPREGDTDAEACDVPDEPVRRIASEQALSTSAARVYTSPALQAPLAFNALGFRLLGDLPSGSRWELDARVSEDGAQWSEWIPADPLDAMAGEARDTDAIFAAGRYAQYRLAVYGAPDDWPGVVEGAQVTFIDSTRGPSSQDAEASGGVIRRLSALVRPSVLTRTSWGANESYRTWPPQYAAVKKIIIHHTATNNDPPDAVAAIRAIYFYHAVTQGWGDIGYNFVIDNAGRVYEGRYGGAGAIAAHAQGYNSGSIGVALLGNFQGGAPTEATLKAVENFVIAKAVQHGIDPNGQGFFVDRVLPNVFGHRDVNSTACPGDLMYTQIPGIRQRVDSGMPLLGQSWVQDATPLLMDPGAQIAVKVVVRNSGKAAWSTNPPNQIRIGFRWLAADGTVYADEPGLEAHTDLPASTNPGDAVTVNALLNAPKKTGAYVLRWDMIQERVSWFFDQGNQPLERTVVVGRLESLSNDVIMPLPNEYFQMLPPARIRTFPLSRLTLLSNTDLVQTYPDIIPLFPNERVLSFSNDLLLRYLPDARLKTFSLDRIRTFAADVQTRLGFPPPPPSLATPTPTSTAPAGLPASSPTAVIGTPTPTPTSTSTPRPTSTVVTSADPGGGVAP